MQNSENAMRARARPTSAAGAASYAFFFLILLGEILIDFTGFASAGFAADESGVLGIFDPDSELMLVSVCVTFLLAVGMSFAAFWHPRAPEHRMAFSESEASSSSQRHGSLDDKLMDRMVTIAHRWIRKSLPGDAAGAARLAMPAHDLAPDAGAMDRPAARRVHCRFCDAPLIHSVVDLGAQPLSNCYLRQSELARPEATWPLQAFVCDSCFLVQIDANEAPERIFSDYAYFSSYSQSWLQHAEDYATRMIGRLSLDSRSQVVEVASNDGYLLQNFVRRSIPSLGIEPAANVARVAINKGIPTRVCFFNTATARKLVRDGYAADLLIGNNVLAHVPALNDFVAALRLLLKPEGTLTLEFPHLLRLIEGIQFDTIYHEHFSYFSLLAVDRIFAAHGLRIFDVDSLPTHGGSLRIYAARASRNMPVSPAVDAMVTLERAAGLDRLETYGRFAERVRRTKRRLIAFLIKAKDEGKTVVGYGAAAKGNTLLNYCGMRSDVVDYVADANPYKQGQYLPGTRIPIVAPERLRETRPDYVLILPWNLKDEIVAQHAYIREWGGRFVVPVPELTVIS